MNTVELNFTPKDDWTKIPITQPNLLNNFNNLNLKWNELCANFLPVAPRGAAWRYSRSFTERDPDQGWKLHISATVLTAGEVLERVAPLLLASQTFFKAPASLLYLRNLNSGKDQNYSQVGKFITVYPEDEAKAVMLAEKLHELTVNFSAPPVPYDFRFKPDSCIYYRYGAFKNIEVKNSDGSTTLSIYDPQRNLVPDLRAAEKAKPEWITNPFPQSYPNEEKPLSPLHHTFRIFRALAQRGKGGVYQALDFSNLPPRFCIVKEGRRNGETDWDGRDGYQRIQNEEFVLKSLSNAGVDVPLFYSSFQAENNYYLVVESIEGKNLHTVLLNRRRRMSFSLILRYGIQLAQIVAQIHAAGFVWRDIKPANLIVMKAGRLRPVDFEGACQVDNPDPLPWNTTFFMPPEAEEDFTHLSKTSADLFALGVVLYLLVEGSKLSFSSDDAPLLKRRNIPFELREIILQLLEKKREKRPAAQIVYEELKKLLALTKSKAERRFTKKLNSRIQS